jgi:hypothetical protein
MDQGDLVDRRGDVAVGMPTARFAGRWRRVTAARPRFGLSNAAQHLDLERKLDDLVAKLPVLGLQSVEQSAILMRVSTAGIHARTAFADRRELENGSGFSTVGYSSASYSAHWRFSANLLVAIEQPCPRPNSPVPIRTGDHSRAIFSSRMARSKMAAIAGLTWHV